MASECASCKKPRRTTGNRITRRGLSKISGGIGLKTTGITPRTWKLNGRKMRVRTADGVQTAWICMKCYKAGKYTKV